MSICHNTFFVMINEDPLYPIHLSEPVTLPRLSYSQQSLAKLLTSDTPSSFSLTRREGQPKERHHIFEESSDEEEPMEEVKRVEPQHRVKRSKALLMCDREGNQQDVEIYHEDDDEKIADKEDSERESTSRGTPYSTSNLEVSATTPLGYLNPEPLPEEPKGRKRSAKNKGIKKAEKKGSAGGKKEGHKTKNMLAFFCTKFVNYFDKVEKVRNMEGWNRLRLEGASLATVSKFYQTEEMQEGFEQMFRSRYLHREVVLSSAKIRSKKNYIKYLRVLERGFEKKKLEYIN